MNKDNFQKFLIKAYKKGDQYVYMVFDNNTYVELLIDIFIGKNKNLLYTKCYYAMDKQAKENKEKYGYTYYSYSCVSEENFNF